MKKFFALIIICLLACPVYAAEVPEDLEVGFLTRLKTNPDEFYKIVKDSWTTKGWAILGGNHSLSTAKFYDSLSAMQLALDRNDIEEMILPDFVAEYLIKINSKYTVSCMSRTNNNMSLCFGFMKNNRELADKWNSALRSMKADWVLMAINQKYLKDLPASNNEYDNIYGTNPRKERERFAIKIENFPNAPIIRVAITGDLPPVDFVNEQGLPAGFNVAVLAEIGRRLRVNIQPVQVESGARAAALVSGRADVVFWFEVNRSQDAQLDIPDGIILSDSYLDWNNFLHVRLDEE